MSTTETPLEVMQERLRRLGRASQRAEELAEDARAARDAAIEDADRERLSVRQIAALVGLSRARVAGVIQERTAARQAHLTRPA